ncbi:MAG: vitamin K epoxide reductase family protein, partial [Dehalococcoidia bacterium]
GSEALCVAGSGCNLVQESAYSAIAGIPVALVGLVGYGAILAAVIQWFRLLDRALVLYVLALAGFVFSSYLTFVELVVVGAVCPFCVLSYGLITAILMMLLVPRPVVRGLPLKRYQGLTASILVVVLAASTVLQFNVGEFVAGEPVVDGPESSTTILAKHLSETGAVMYGAYWCPHCADQKAIFGDAIEYINYVECDPKGEDGNPFQCALKRIQVYPTWEIGGRMYEGVFQLQALAELSGLTLAGP